MMPAGCPAEPLPRPRTVAAVRNTQSQWQPMAEGNAASRAIKWIITRSKSVPAIVLRTIFANLLSTGDLASDLYTIVSLFALGHDGAASALLTMVCLSFAFQVRAWMRCVRRVPLIMANPRPGLSRCSWPSS
jgi:hypothetical protein